MKLKFNVFKCVTQLTTPHVNDDGDDGQAGNDCDDHTFMTLWREEVLPWACVCRGVLRCRSGPRRTQWEHRRWSWSRSPGTRRWLWWNSWRWAETSWLPSSKWSWSAPWSLLGRNTKTLSHFCIYTVYIFKYSVEFFPFVLVGKTLCHYYCEHKLWEWSQTSTSCANSTFMQVICTQRSQFMWQKYDVKHKIGYTKKWNLLNISFSLHSHIVFANNEDIKYTA